MIINDPNLPRRSLGISRRQSVRLSAADVVDVSQVAPDQSIPVLVRQRRPSTDLIGLAEECRSRIDALLAESGAILFRGFHVNSPEEFARFIGAAAGPPLEYTERSSPRSVVARNVYTSTDFPAEYAIFLHNENSYQANWPMRLFFLCTLPAENGGETPIADCRKIYRRVDPDVRATFERRGIMYVRNFSDTFGLSWQTVFQTSDKREVEDYCTAHELTFAWKSDGGLRTTRVGRAIAHHPVTGEPLWFNHAAFFHVTTLDPDIRDGLLRQVAAADLPNNTYYGDGGEIEPEVMDHLRDAYTKETVAFSWQHNDILLIDNMLVAHGRAPYSGPRRVLVGMAQSAPEAATLEKRTPASAD
jgi:alpha-ketoglutarate-dependent taurine dioxygenase